MIESWNVAFPAQTGDAERRAYVYVPDFLEDEPDVRLPVLYMFDGHNLFFDEEATYGKSWGLLDYMEQSGAPLIIAAVACNQGRNNERLREYCPFNAEIPGFGRIRGRGRATLEWYLHDFKPYIDANYPTLPDRDHTFIGGSSMGGLMSLFAVTEYNRYFSRCAALSPSIWFEEKKMEKMLGGHRLRRGTVVYMDYGEKELGRRGMAAGFGWATVLLMGRGALVTSRIVPGGDHSEGSWEKQIPFFINTLLYDLE